MSKLKLALLSLICSLQAITVESKPVTDTLTLKGKVSSYEVEYLHLPYDAKISPLQPYGHVVEKGEPIFTVEYLSQDQSIGYQIIQYLHQEHAFSIHTRHVQTQKELVEAGAISQKAYMETTLDYEKKYSDLETQRASIVKTLEPYDINLEEIHNLEDSSVSGINSFIKDRVSNVIHSPISGILLASTNDPHASIFKKQTHIAKVVNHEAYEIQLNVNEKQFSKIFEGQPVSITIPTLEKKLNGVVFNVNPYPISETGKSQYKITIRFVDIEEQDLSQLVLGMSCITNINLTEKQAILIPLDAILTLGDKSMVKLAKDDQFVGIREITLGQTHGDNIEVLSGLKPGEEIIEHYSN